MISWWNLGPKAHKWLLTMLNICFMENKIPTVWRQSKIIAILKPGKDGYEEGMITGTTFVDLSAAYDTSKPSTLPSKKLNK